MSGIEKTLAPGWFRSVARVTIELTAPMSIGTGTPGDFEDDLVVSDANGLPTLPGTSLAGALRAAALRVHSEAQTKSWFGFMKGGKAPEAQRSAVAISWGAIHNQRDQPVAPLMSPDAIRDDAVLSNAAAGLLRDHVRLDVFGVADDRGKFDRSSVPRGHRFTFELELVTDTQPTAADGLDAILTLLPSVRLGGHTRSGLGTFEVKRVLKADFDLRKRDDFKNYTARPLGLGDAFSALKPMTVQPAASKGEGVETIEVVLRPEEPWLVGATDQPESDTHLAAGGGKGPDLMPYKEARIVWASAPGVAASGKVEVDYCVPGSALKGALRHRVAFALRARAGLFAEVDSQSVAAGSKPEHAPADPPGLVALFGSINNEKLHQGGTERERGQPGRLFISEGALLAGNTSGNGSARARNSMHVSLDRFTGAPMKGRLFEDQALEGGAVRFSLELRPPSEGPDAVEAWRKAREALDDVLRDIERGLFQFGAGYGRGYGWCRGTISPAPRTLGGAR